jgi:hypothetical protein
MRDSFGRQSGRAEVPAKPRKGQFSMSKLLTPDQLATIRAANSPERIRAKPNWAFLTINNLLEHITAQQSDRQSHS